MIDQNIKIYNSINKWVFELIENDFKASGLSSICAAYISSLLDEKSRNLNNINESIINLYNDALSESSFIKYQDIGDLCIFREIIDKKTVSDYRDIHMLYAKKAYYECFKYSMFSLDMYKELSENTLTIVSITRSRILNEHKYKNIQ